jgi:hypothetical protein
MPGESSDEEYDNANGEGGLGGRGCDVMDVDGGLQVCVVVCVWLCVSVCLSVYVSVSCVFLCIDTHR